MTNFLRKHQLKMTGILIGGILGFAYSYFIGCNSGTCAITSKPLNSSIYGMIMGYLLFSMMEHSKIQKEI